MSILTEFSVYDDDGLSALQLMEELAKGVKEEIDPILLEESARKLQEGSRQLQETTRKENETERENQEGTRQTQEKTRQLQEVNRVTSEETRSQFYNGFNAQLTEKVQNFKLRNEVVNGNFSNGTNGWSSVAANINVVSGVMELLATASGGRIYQTILNPYNSIWYIFAKVKSSSNQVVLANPTGGVLKAHSGSNLFEFLSGVASLTNVSSVNFQLVRDYRSSGFDNIEIDFCGAVNLTEIFGTGNEPSKLEMDELIKVIPNQCWDGELNLTQQQYVNWLLSFIREKANKTQEPWITPTLLNGATGSLQYRKNQFNKLEFKGTISNAFGTTSVSLPIGYRPFNNTKVLVPKSDSSGYRIILCTTSGSIVPDLPSGNFEVDMSGISIPL